jgi:hypothetical protein
MKVFKSTCILIVMLLSLSLELYHNMSYANSEEISIIDDVEEENEEKETKEDVDPISEKKINTSLSSLGLNSYLRQKSTSTRVFAYQFSFQNLAFISLPDLPPES